MLAGLADLKLLKLPVSQDSRRGDGKRVPVATRTIGEAGVIAQPTSEDLGYGYGRYGCMAYGPIRDKFPCVWLCNKRAIAL